jgi:uncharacterized protein
MSSNPPLTRNISYHLIDLMRKFPVVAIVGARQTGKTTLAKSVAPDFAYFDLEKPGHYDRIVHDPEFFLTQYPDHLILDEAQELPVLFNILRGVVDQNREQMGRFIITGSSSADLLSHISETLAGRIAIIELGTLKANEFYRKPLSPFYDLLQSRISKKNLVIGKPPLTIEQMQHCWLRGGYPEPVIKLNQSNDHYFETWMANYQATYINRDIAKLFPKLNKITYRRFLIMLCKLSGNILNKSDLARALEVSEPTVNHYLEIANGTFVWRKISSYEHNSIKSLVKMPKGHIRDSGLLHQLLHINDLEFLYQDPIVGRSFESFVIEEILKGIQDAGIPNVEFSYHRTYGGAEIDLILEGNFGLLPIEIKLGKTIIRRKLTTLENFINEHHLDFGLLINQSDSIEWLTPSILQIPVGWL